MRSVRMGTTMNKLLAAAAALVAVAVVPANAQKFDFSPVKPQAITKAKIKTDLLGFRIEMNSAGGARSAEDSGLQEGDGRVRRRPQRHRLRPALRRPTRFVRRRRVGRTVSGVGIMTP